MARTTRRRSPHIASGKPPPSRRVSTIPRPVARQPRHTLGSTGAVYSRRSASNGSTPDARLAGIQLASAATAVSRSGTPANVSGSIMLGP